MLANKKSASYQPPSRNSLPSLQPTDLNELIRLLGSCLSHDSSIQKPAEQMLHEIEKRNGYMSLLHQVLANDQLNFQLRYLASICFKHGVNSYWRNGCGYCVSDGEKQYLRGKLLETVNIDNWQIVVQLGLAIAKINRTDFPQDWDNFFISMTDVIQKGSEFQRERALFIVGQFLKEQITRKLGHSPETFRQLTLSSLEFMRQLWQYYVGLIAESLTGSKSETILLVIKNCLNTTKILRRMITYGIQYLDANKEAMTFFEQLLKAISQFYSFRRECEKRQISNDFTMMITKLLATLMKVPLRVQNNHLLQMRSFLPSYLQFALQVVLECDPKTTDSQDMFVVRSLTFLKNVVESPKFNGQNDAAREAKEIVLVKFFNDQVLATLCNSLISKYMILSEEELIQWESDPELFIKEQETDYTGTLKSAAELLFISLLDTFETSLSPYVANFAMRILNETFGSLDQDKLLLRDAVYSAIGWASHTLQEHFNFPEYFKQMLSKEIQMNDKRYKIIRRRGVWLIGRWVDSVDDNVLSDVLKSLLTTLNEDDVVLKLSSLLSLKSILDQDKDFATQNYNDFLDPFINSAFHLLSTVEEEDTKLTLLNLFTIFIERMHVDILPYAPTLMQYLPILWNQSNDEYLVKSAIVTAITKLTETLAGDSPSIYGFILPLIKYSTNVEVAEHFYFLDEGLELWQTTLHQAPVITPELLELFPNLLAMLALNLDNLILALRIVESYVLLGKGQFMELYAHQLGELFMNIVGEVKDKPMMLCLNVIDTILVLFPEQAPKILHKPLVKLLKQVLVGDDTPIVKSNSVSTFSRIIFDNTPAFFALVDSVTGLIPDTNAQKTCVKFIEIWLDQADHIISAFKRKLSALALITLLPTQNNEILAFFPDVINISVQVLYEVEDVLLGTAEDQEYEKNNSERNEYERKRMQMKNDRAVHIDVYDYLMAKFDLLSKAMGGQQFQQYLTSKVDAKILTQLSNYLTVKQRRQ